jgi:hypothetical protein
MAAAVEDWAPPVRHVFYDFLQPHFLSRLNLSLQAIRAPPAL